HLRRPLPGLARLTIGTDGDHPHGVKVRRVRQRVALLRAAADSLSPPWKGEVDSAPTVAGAVGSLNSARALARALRWPCRFARRPRARREPERDDRRGRRAGLASAKGGSATNRPARPLRQAGRQKRTERPEGWSPHRPAARVPS